MLVVFDRDIPAGFTFGDLIRHSLYGEDDRVVFDAHLVTCAFIASNGITLMHRNVVKSTSIDAIHGEILPYEMSGVYHTGKLAEPWGSGEIVDAVSTPGDKLYVMAIFGGVALL